MELWSPNLEGFFLSEVWHHGVRVLAVGPAGQTELYRSTNRMRSSGRLWRNMLPLCAWSGGAPSESITVRPLHQALPGKALSEGGLTVLPGTLACEGVRSQVAGFVLNSPETPEENHVVAALCGASSLPATLCLALGSALVHVLLSPLLTGASPSRRGSLTPSYRMCGGLETIPGLHFSPFLRGCGACGNPWLVFVHKCSVLEFSCFDQVLLLRVLRPRVPRL